MSGDEVIREAARIAAGVFAREGWRYGLTEQHVPDAEYIEDRVIRYLMRSVDEHKTDRTQTGRILVHRDKYGYEIYLNLGYIDGPERAELTE